MGRLLYIKFIDGHFNEFSKIRYPGMSLSIKDGPLFFQRGGIMIPRRQEIFFHHLLSTCKIFPPLTAQKTSFNFPNLA